MKVLKMARTNNIGLLAVAAILTGASVRVEAGALIWNQQMASVVVQPEQTKAFVAYSFHNGGSDPVSIETIEPSCGCISATASKGVYAPGESGSIDVAFTVGDRTGEVRKTIAITTDEPGREQAQLIFKATVLQYLAIEPLIV